MTKLKRYDDFEFVKTFAFRGPPRSYGQSDIAGMTAVLASAKGDRVQVVTTDINSVYVDNIDDETFWWAYEPALDLTVEAAALELRSCMRTWIRPKTTEAPVLIDKILENPTPEPVMTAPTKQQAEAAKTAAVFKDYQQRTAIVVFDGSSETHYVPLLSIGLELVVESTADFRQRWTRVDTYPVARAAALYAGYAQHIGGTQEAMAALAKFINITQKEIDMATTKKSENTAEKPAKVTKVVKAEPAEKPAKAAKAPKSEAALAEKPAKAAKPAKEPKEKAEKAPRESASQMFKDLIMEGKLTDDQIFEKVAAKFGLDESKRSYVGWNRNWLKKNGHNPPEAKVAKPAKK